MRSKQRRVQAHKTGTDNRTGKVQGLILAANPPARCYVSTGTTYRVVIVTTSPVCDKSESLLKPRFSDKKGNNNNNIERGEPA